MISINKGLSGHRLYKIWYLMLYRCSNTKYPQYLNYGGKGIKVCDDWLDFETFIRDMYPSYKENYTIDRLDTEGNYCKDNCQWLTRGENSKKDTSKGMNQYTLTGDFIKSFEAMSDACLALGLAKNHGGLNRAHKQKKPFKGFRWARKDDYFPLDKGDMTGTLINKDLPIYQLNKETGEVIQKWDTAKEASDVLKISDASISQVSKGKRNSAGGFKWIYK